MAQYSEDIYQTDQSLTIIKQAIHLQGYVVNNFLGSGVFPYKAILHHQLPEIETNADHSLAFRQWTSHLIAVSNGIIKTKTKHQNYCT